MSELQDIYQIEQTSRRVRFQQSELPLIPSEKDDVTEKDIKDAILIISYVIDILERGKPLDIYRAINRLKSAKGILDRR